MNERNKTTNAMRMKSGKHGEEEEEEGEFEVEWNVIRHFYFAFLFRVCIRALERSVNVMSTILQNDPDIVNK